MAKGNNVSYELSEINTISALSRSLSVYDSYHKYVWKGTIMHREVADAKIASLQRQLMEVKDLVVFSSSFYT